MLFDKIQKICTERKISIARLEREAGIGNATIRGWKVSEPNTKTIRKVADYLGMTVDDLLTADDPSDVVE